MEVCILHLEERDLIVAFKRCGVKKIFRVYKIKYSFTSLSAVQRLRSWTQPYTLFHVDEFQNGVPIFHVTKFGF